PTGHSASWGLCSLVSDDPAKLRSRLSFDLRGAHGRGPRRRSSSSLFVCSFGGFQDFERALQAVGREECLPKGARVVETLQIAGDVTASAADAVQLSPNGRVDGEVARAEVEQF